MFGILVLQSKVPGLSQSYGPTNKVKQLTSSSFNLKKKKTKWVIALQSIYCQLLFYVMGVDCDDKINIST